MSDETKTFFTSIENPKTGDLESIGWSNSVIRAAQIAKVGWGNSNSGVIEVQQDGTEQLLRPDAEVSTQTEHQQGRFYRRPQSSPE